MNKRAILIAGLGPFYGAGKRLCLQCKALKDSHDLIFVDDRKLINIVKPYGLTADYFTIKERGYGFWQWKCIVISHYCNKEYDELIYIDAGCDANGYRLLELINWFNNQDRFDLVLSKTGHSIAEYTKPSAIEYFQEYLSASKYDLNALEMLQSGFILLKSNTKIAESFAGVASLAIQKKKYLFDDTKVSKSDQEGLYLDHRHDQSMINLWLLAKADLARIGVLNSSLTPPDHLRGWMALPPIIASRNQSCLSNYVTTLRFVKHSKSPRIICLIWKFLNILAKKLNYPSILLLFYIWIERLLLGTTSYSFSTGPLFSEEGTVSPAPAYLLDS